MCVSEHSDIPNLVSVSTAAKKLGVTPQQVRRLVVSGELSGTKISGSWVISSGSLGKLASERGIAVTNAKPTRKGRKNQMKVLSFFSGAMGLDIGLENSGLQTILACESDKWSRETIRLNRPDIPVLGDIWQHDAASVRDAIGYTEEQDIDVVAGGPPCQAFSTAGKRQGFEDERGNVFLHFLELSIQLKPKYLVIENVRGLLSAPMRHRPHADRSADNPLSPDERAGGALRYIIDRLETEGYGVSFNLYNAANYGAPQTRERVIMICSRDGTKVPHLPPTRSENGEFGLPKWASLKSAVGDLAEHNMNAISFPESRLKYYRLLSEGQYWKHLPEHLQREALGNSFYSGGGKTGFLRRLSWDKPSPTLVTHPAMPATDLAHPEELRPLSIEEYKRIQAFPDNWELAGPLIQQYKQIGNAVPIPLGEAVGRQLIRHSKGAAETPPLGFKFSRYRNTSDLDFAGDKENLLF